MSSQLRPLNNFLNFVMFVLIFILTIKSSSCDSTLTNFTEISHKSTFSTNSILSNIRNWFTGLSESDNDSESRTFGHIRRLQMALIPILIKFGVMSAMITVLVFLALKTVFLLKTLLLLNVGALLVKLVGWKLSHHNQYQPQQPVFYGYTGGWNPHQKNTWEKSHNDNKEVHLHIHNDGKLSEVYHSQAWNRNDNDPYYGYTKSNKRDINEQFENHSPITISKSYRNVDNGYYN